MRIAEIFYSIQGEGRLAGAPSVFIRTSGCNLRCVWCDTSYTSWRPKGEPWSIKGILAEAKRHRTRRVVITGGEPFVAREIGELTAKLKQRGYHITIETAGTVFKPVACDLMSISPKLSNSTPWKREKGRFARMHEGHRLNLPVIQRLIDGYDYQLKFVVEQKRDFPEIEKILKQLKRIDREKILIMAQARSKRELRERAPRIVELCKSYGFSYTPRLQIELYGNRRGR